MKKIVVFFTLSFLFGWLNAQQLCNSNTSLSNGTPLLYVTSFFEDNQGIFETTLDIPDGGTKLNDINFSFQAMERTTGEDIYVAVWSEEGGFWGTNHFGKIDRSGNLTLIAEEVEWDGISMAWNPVTETMYAMTLVGEFGTVNLATGAFTEIAYLDWWYTIAIDNNGVCYAWEWGDPADGQGQFGTMDLETGTFTHISFAAEEVFDFQGLQFDRQTNELYWQAVFENGSKTDFYRIDKTTGALTLLGQTTERFMDFVILDNSEVKVIDAELQAILSPNTGIGLTDSESVIVQIRNNGTIPLTGFQVKLELDGSEIITDNFTGIIANLESAEYTFSVPVNLSEEGEYNIKTTVIVAGDVDPENNFKNKIVKNTMSNSITDFSQHKDLKAWMRNGIMYVSGLTIGERYEIYDINGRLVSQRIAHKNVENIELSVSGIYIVQSAGNALKVVF